ncbi:hypothetical protein [Bifidobacterium apri]|uniref:Uncharacterized protein n=1 Tax=Bifidobacterium apri TaxID=1769423 RepID=A0A6A2V6R7_9BIFI|nr:hypothetical protein [Bifidobacterium apri]KAB8295711.1 hypothetical protein DSM100238_1575 [Bifidobacterium apri]
MKRITRALLSSAAALGICACATVSANAYIQYPVSSGSTNIGYYQASWNVTPTRSEVTGYSVSKQHYCKAVQDKKIIRYQTASTYTSCHVVANGTQAAHDDWVEYSYF